ncbi:hypothetical protein CU254_42110 (plasmid) [Amycolatopsis sp. AA4]|uniref:phthiocerol/phthiodiolone dimycocerosyl transferase family protein n=1 Tax=Actinomycetes TaxID=1760 RepID=UPI0001B56BFF|nr:MULTISPECIES: hypothetical protein [Actinomycetes]ATY17172.1 hypothetical protein CU254_42110 [Amycolatopsis sp. AA4]EFL12594.1 predicted protein [Streptomyces sp. AA4]
MTVLERYLDNIELGGLGTPRAQVARFHGHLDTDALASAYRDLCDAHPILRSRVIADPAGQLLSAADRNPPPIRVRDGGDDVLDREARRPWDPAQGVAELLLIRGQESGYLVLRADIGVVDGRGWTALYYELWHRYTAIVTGSTPQARTRGSLPASPAELAAQRWSGPPVSAPSNMDRAPIVQLDDRLSPAETRGIVAAARARGISVTGLVTGIVLISLRTFGTPVAGPAAMVCLTAVDLRQRVTPPVAATETSKFVAWHRADLQVAHDSDPAALGHTVKRNLEQGIASRQLPLGYPSLSVETPLEQRLAKVVVSNIGVVPDIEHPPDVRITGWSRIIPFNRPYPLFGVYTFLDRLHLIAAYPATLFSRVDAAALTYDVTTRLRAIADPFTGLGSRIETAASSAHR